MDVPSGIMLVMASYTWLMTIFFSSYSLLFCAKKKRDVAKDRSSSGDGVVALPPPHAHALPTTSPNPQASSSFKHRTAEADSTKGTVRSGQSAKPNANEKAADAEAPNDQLSATRNSSVPNDPPHAKTPQRETNEANDKHSNSSKKRQEIEEQFRSRRRRILRGKDGKKKGLKQNFVDNALRKWETKRKAGVQASPTDATQDESQKQLSAKNAILKKKRRTKRVSRTSVSANTPKSRQLSKNSRIGRLSCTSTQSDATGIGIGPQAIPEAVGGDDYDGDEVNNDLDTMAGVRSIEREETPSA